MKYPSNIEGLILNQKAQEKGFEQVIGVRKDKLYKLQFDSHYALSSNNDSRDYEIWHMRMAHLGLLKLWEWSS
jgi:hypothetical protein